MTDQTQGSSFDPDTFMQQTIDQPLETDFRLCPPGEFQAMIDDFTSEAFEQIQFTYKKGDKAGQDGVMTKFNLPFTINDEKAKQELGRDKVVVTKQMILDVVPGTNQLDWGPNKNIELGRVRAATGQNNPGAWAVSNLRGAGPVMVKVEHVEYPRKDGTKGKRAEVTRVVKIV